MSDGDFKLEHTEERPALLVERAPPALIEDKCGGSILRRVAMDAWQQDAFDRLLTSAGAESPRSVVLSAGTAPRLSRGQDWQLSASHTGSDRPKDHVDTHLAVAAQNGEAETLRVGVDVEQHRPRSAASIAAMEKLLDWPVPSQSSEEFYRRWTAAEAIFKTGLLPAATTADWFNAVAPLASKRLGAEGTFAECRIGGWHARLWWFEMAAPLTLCLVSARRASEP